MNKTIFLFFSLFSFLPGYSQLGGSHVFSALQLPVSPRAAAMGGMAIGVQGHDLSLALDNPAFIDSTLHKNIFISNTFYLSGVNYGALAYAHTFKKVGTFTGAIQYAAYGKFDGRDISGNPTGLFKAGDYNIQFGTGRSIKHFIYGANAKFLFSNLGGYKSIAIATDVAAGFHNEEKQLTATIMVQDLGIQLKSYTSEGKEKLPWDLAIGFSKGLKKIPVRLSIVAHHLQKFDIRYDDPNAQQDPNIFGQDNSEKKYIIDKLFRHFTFGTEVNIKKIVYLRFGYNHLRRKELTFESKKGLGGVTAGLGIHVKQFTLDYAYAKYSSVASANHIGINVNLNEFGLKKKEKSSQLPE